MRLYALVQSGDPEAIDVYLAEEDAQRALEDCLRDEPQWRGSVWSRSSSSTTNTRRSTSYFARLIRSAQHAPRHLVILSRGVPVGRNTATPVAPFRRIAGQLTLTASPRP